MDWQPIETAPNDVRILITDGLSIAVGLFDDSLDSFLVSWDMSTFHGATHWMPLPEPPSDR